mgnify:FL=1
MVIIMDDVVGNATFQTDCVDLLQQNKNEQYSRYLNERWYSLDQEHHFQDFCVKMINIAASFYDFSTCSGYEFWSHYNTRPSDWHIDQDEQLKNITGQTRFPLCSMVYYAKVENLKGGNLHIEDDIIRPKSNRLVIFSPKLDHFVEPLRGDRISLCINPWSIKL